MKKVLEKIRSFFAATFAKFKRKPKATPASNEPITTPRGQKTAKPKKADLFAIISWGVTLLLAAALLGGTVVYKNSRPATRIVAQPTSAPTESAGVQPQVGAPAVAQGGGRGLVHLP